MVLHEQMLPHLGRCIPECRSTYIVALIATVTHHCCRMRTITSHVAVLEDIDTSKTMRTGTPKAIILERIP